MIRLPTHLLRHMQDLVDRLRGRLIITKARGMGFTEAFEIGPTNLGQFRSYVQLYRFYEQCHKW